MSEDEIGFDAMMLTIEHERWFNERIGRVVIEMTKAQIVAENHEETGQCQKHLKRLREELMYIHESFKGSLEEIINEHEKILRARYAAEETARKATAHLENFSKRLDEVQQQEASRHREHNPALPEVRARVLAMTDGRCAYCNSVISPGKSDGNPEFVVEHVVPKSAGGPDHIANFVPSCAPCNSQKSAAHVVEFIRKKVGGLNV